MDGSGGGVGLSPPQYGLERKLRKTVGRSPHVEVMEVYEEQSQGEVGSHWVIEIRARESGGGDLPGALATILKRFYDFEGIRVQVRVLDPLGREASAVPSTGLPVGDAIKLLETVFRDNPLFVTIHHPTGWPFDVSVEFKAEIVQYWNDDLSDHYGNTNLVAARAFSDVMNEFLFEETVSVGTSTSPVRYPQASSFIRGDCNGDLAFDISDPIKELGFLFSSAAPPPCEDACDSNDDGTLDIADAIWSLAALFASGPLPPSPFPSCGIDTTRDALSCVRCDSCPDTIVVE